jgi:hypothetical protein
MSRLRQWTSWHDVVTNARRRFHAQTSLRKWALHQKYRYSLQVQLRLPVTAMFTGINLGSGPWCSRSRAGHNCQQLFASCLSAYVTISSLYRVSTALLPPFTIALFLFSVPLFISSVWFFAYPVCHHNSLTVITISHLTNMRLLYFTRSSFSLAYPLPALAHPFFIASLLFCCA